MSSNEGHAIVDIIEFNPSRALKKGTEAPFIEMADLPVNSRDITSIGKRIFSGSGSKFKNGDTLFARITPCLENGKTAKVTGLENDQVAHGSTEFIVFSPKNPNIDEDFVYYIARLPEFRLFAISQLEGTSGRQRVAWQSLSKFDFEFPEEAERKTIGKFLRKLDDKIELNRQINQTFEQIAQAIFKSWFVDFEPVKAKIWANENGHDPERAAMCALVGLPYADDALDHLSPEQQQQLATTAALFPDSLEESELGEIPSGWRLATLKEITTKIGSGATPSGGKSVYADTGIAQIRSLNVFDGSFSLADLVFITDEQAAKLKNVIVESDDVLLNITGASVTRCCVVPPSVLPARVNQHVCIIRADKKSVNAHYIYHSLTYPTGKGLLLSLSQAGATREALTKAHIEGFQILRPDPELVSRFGVIAKSLQDQKHKLDEESASLAQLRDTLLPKLLSGELSVADLPEFADAGASA